MSTENRWACEDCDWPWPLPGSPPAGAECDSCGGELVRSPAPEYRSAHSPSQETRDEDR